MTIVEDMYRLYVLELAHLAHRIENWRRSWMAYTDRAGAAGVPAAQIQIGLEQLECRLHRFGSMSSHGAGGAGDVLPGLAVGSTPLVFSSEGIWPTRWAVLQDVILDQNGQRVTVDYYMQVVQIVVAPQGDDVVGGGGSGRGLGDAGGASGSGRGDAGGASGKGRGRVHGSGRPPPRSRSRHRPPSY